MQTHWKIQPDLKLHSLLYTLYTLFILQHGLNIFLWIFSRSSLIHKFAHFSIRVSTGHTFIIGSLVTWRLPLAMDLGTCEALGWGTVMESSDKVRPVSWGRVRGVVSAGERSLVQFRGLRSSDLTASPKYHRSNILGLWSFLMCVLVARLYPTLCESMDYSTPCSSVYGILQARILEWIATPFSRGIFPTQGLNPGLLHCNQVLYNLSYSGSP